MLLLLRLRLLSMELLQQRWAALVAPSAWWGVSTLLHPSLPPPNTWSSKLVVSEAPAAGLSALLQPSTWSSKWVFLSALLPLF
jgi:hypothetical protein